MKKKKKQTIETAPVVEESIGYDLSDDEAPVGEIALESEEARCYEGEVITEYLLASADDEQHRHGQIIPCGRWEDLREAPVGELPMPKDGLYNVWELQRAATRSLLLGSQYHGMLYRAGNGREILTRAMPLASFSLGDLIKAICGGGAAAPPPPCPTRTPISGSGRAHSAFYKTAAAAQRAADGLVPGRARVDAGLKRNAHQCPNPACTRKSLGPVRHVITGRSGGQLSLIVSFFYLEWRYSAWSDYTWASTVVCR